MTLAQIITGDCRKVLRSALAEPDSIDAIITDPPYGLGFMGRDWDRGVPGVEFWAEILRVAKPGAHLLAFGGTRTHHRMMCAIEDAGWELRDTIMWVYGSGFPKSHNLGDGRGTALKSAWEPIIMARKPLVGTVATNVDQFGTGVLNIDLSRIGTESTRRIKHGGSNQFPHEDDAWKPRTVQVGSDHGRWPANLIHDGSDEVLRAFPDAPGQIASASTNAEARKAQNVYGAMRRGRGDEASADSDNKGAVSFGMKPGMRRLDAGSAARFFYCAKASRKDRDEGLEGFEHAKVHGPSGDGRCWDIPGSKSLPRANHHPTVKPTELMRYLVRLVTPSGGTILDPFCGSGSTGKAAVLEWCNFIGIDLAEEYTAIAARRVAHAQRQAA